MDPTILSLSILRGLAVLLGLTFLFYTWRAYLKHRSSALMWLWVAIAIMVLAAIIEGIAVQVLGLTLDQSHILESVVTLAGFSVLVMSVIVPRRRRMKAAHAPPDPGPALADSLNEAT